MIKLSPIRPESYYHKYNKKNKTKTSIRTHFYFRIRIRSIYLVYHFIFLILRKGSLFLFGLNKKLGPIVDWNLELSDKKISVDTENYQTSSKGIFAVGDINDYPGKLDLILCGFHETTLAVQEAYRRSHPGEKVPFAYTTSNTKLQRKLGVSD